MKNMTMASNTDKLGAKRRNGVFLGVVVLAALCILGHYNYLLFHTLVELAEVIAGIAIFLLFWNARRNLDDSLLFLACVACLLGCVFDLLHVVTTKGFSVFPGCLGEESIHFKTAGRLIVCMTLLVVPFLQGHRIRLRSILITYSLVFLFVLSTVFANMWPDFYTQSGSVALIQRIVRGICCVVFLLAAAALKAKSKGLDRQAYKLILLYLFASAASELFSAVCTDFYGLQKIIAHLLELISILFIYRAFLVLVLRSVNEQVLQDLKHSRDVVRGSEEHSRLLAENASDVFWTLDLTGRFTYVSSSVAQMLGYMPEELVGRTVEELLAASPAGSAYARFMKYLANIRNSNRITNESIQLELNAKDGSTVWAELTASGMYDLSGGIVAFQVTLRNITERKEAEAAFRDSEHKYRTLFESSRDAIMTLSPPVWRFTDGNPAAIEMFGARGLDDFLSNNPADVSPKYQPDGRLSAHKAKEMIEKALKDGSTIFEWTHKRLSGEEFPATVLLTRCEHDGRVFVQGTVRSTSEQTRLEKQRQLMLERQHGLNALQRELLATAPLDEKLKRTTDWVVDLLKADFCRIWIVKPGDLCESGCAHTRVAQGPHVCKHRDQCLHLMASSGRYTHIDGEVHRRVPFGCYKIGAVAADEVRSFLTNHATTDPRVHNHDWAKELGLVSFAGYQLRPPDGKTIGVLALFSQREITADDDTLLENIACSTARVIQNAYANDALQESEKKYRILFESSRDAIVTCSPPNWKFTNANPAALELFGVSSLDELMSKCPWDVAPEHQPDGRSSASSGKEIIEKVLDEGSNFIEWTHTRSNGEEFPATVLMTRCEQEGRVFVQATVRDVTEWKRLEMELNHAQKLESIGQLAAGIAHEINTPTQYVGDNIRFLQEIFTNVDGLLGELDRLLEAARLGNVTEALIAEVEARLREAEIGYLKTEIPKAIQQSFEGIEHVAKIVRAMKDFAHPGGENKQLVDLNRAIETTLTVSHNEWKYIAQVVTDFDPTLPLVPCLAGDFNQVILNVVVNAAQAIATVVGDGSQAQGVITIRTRRDGDWAEISVQDTGSGIPASIRGKIFDQFFTTKEVGKGTGLGLSIAHSIVVQKHAGTITFQTEEGKGTVFVIRVPLVDKPRTEQHGQSENICALTGSQAAMTASQESGPSHGGSPVF
jgi:PAS domain S-box-containing protein